INSLGSKKAFNQSTVNEKLFKIDGSTKKLPEIIDIFDNEVSGKGINAASGGHLGYIPGGGIFSSSLADMMVDISNEYAGIYFASPGGVTMENELIKWMSSIFGYPETTVGNLTSGGSIANLIALTSARDRHQIKGAKIEKSVIYLSEQTHHCIHKALKIIGLEDLIIRHVQVDDRSRMSPEDLNQHIQEDKIKGLFPFMIVASAGTTDTGAIDPLNSIADISQANHLWLHVDAAYGGFFIITDLKKDRFKGIERSDSLVVDPHKGLFLPYGIGAVLIKNKKAVYHSHHATAHYMQDALEDKGPINPADVSPELTKHFRGMRMWLPLQLHGIKPFAACLEEKILLTSYIRKHLLQAGFQLGPEPDLSVTYFWYEPKKTDVNLFNKKLLSFMHEDGRYFFSSTQIKDRFVIRAAILSFRTKLREVDLAIKMIHTCLDKTHEYFKSSKTS
ncbi:pyridoxal phosphate-dependent decarboxylase family protein, partial [Lutimonas sp.]|uniref:pyridoxal phosphate-dependent decarboxylase family protein n=1 Tax=Lutimonas sp. TaxID=1872403 RepID=UPI003C71B747